MIPEYDARLTADQRRKIVAQLARRPQNAEGLYMPTLSAWPVSMCSVLGWPDDEPTAYALGVYHGAYSAGPHVRATCERHLKDLLHGHTRGLVWCPGRAERVLRFFRGILRLSGGEFDGAPFDPLPWQAFVLGSLFGWYKLEPGVADIPRWWQETPAEWRAHTDQLTTKEAAASVGRATRFCKRRFRRAYVETGKGSGKSPLAAGVGLYGLLADDEAQAEVYAAATKKDQAMILFRDAHSMVDQSPWLGARIKVSGKLPNVWNLFHSKSRSFFKPIASDTGKAAGHSGPRPHVALIDELHEHPDGTIVEMLRAGFKGRWHPLILMITNSGASLESYCREQHTLSAQVAAGIVEDDGLFAYAAACEAGYDPFVEADPAARMREWTKANPSLGAVFGLSYLEEQVKEARGLPSKESLVKRLNFCIWTQAYNPWVSFELWARNAGEPLPLEPSRPIYGGLDLSMKNDLTAYVLTQETNTPEGRRVSVHPRFWAPQSKVDDDTTDRVPYKAWVKAGHLTPTPGDVIDYDFVADQLAQDISRYPHLRVYFDRYKIDLMRAALERRGIALDWEDEDCPLQMHGQGFKDMSPAIDYAEDTLIQGQYLHGGNPVLGWCVANAVVVKDPAELRKFDKAKATGRIDGAVALVMATRGLQTAGRDDFDDFLSDMIELDF